MATNPVASAEYFNFVIEKFISILMVCGREHKIGIFGRVSSYYGAVEAKVAARSTCTCSSGKKRSGAESRFKDLESHSLQIPLGSGPATHYVVGQAASGLKMT